MNSKLRIPLCWKAIAPVTAVRGNVDGGAWAQKLPLTRTITIDNVRIHLIHIVADLKLDPVAEKISVVISGHSHTPAITHEKGVLYLNPGSAGPRRFNLPVTVAILTITGAKPEAQIVELKV